MKSLILILSTFLMMTSANALNRESGGLYIQRQYVIFDFLSIGSGIDKFAHTLVHGLVEDGIKNKTVEGIQSYGYGIEGEREICVSFAGSITDTLSFSRNFISKYAKKIASVRYIRQAGPTNVYLGTSCDKSEASQQDISAYLE